MSIARKIYIVCCINALAFLFAHLVICTNLADAPPPSSMVNVSECVAFVRVLEILLDRRRGASHLSNKTIVI